MNKFARIMLAISFVAGLALAATPAPALAQPLRSVADGFDYPVGKPDGVGWDLCGGYGYLAWAYVGKDNAGKNMYEWHPGVDLNWCNKNDVGQPVYAVANGIVSEAAPGAIWDILIEHTLLLDGSKVWSNYKHIQRAAGLTPGTTIVRGQQIGTIDSNAHLHFEIRSQPPTNGLHGTDWMVGRSKEWVTARFVDPLKFIKEHRPNTPCCVKETVFKNGSSRLGQDQNWGRANLQVCATNLPGNTVYVYFNRNGREWTYSQKAASTCVTFWDMDGAGPLNRGTTYYSRAALNQQPNKSWSIPCAVATGGQGLCDSLRRP